MSEPQVTVVIPTYNWSTAVRCAIQSVLAQDFEDFELLVVGDGCTDDTAAVVARATAVDARVQWIDLPRNAGTQVIPNNVGLSCARGELIAYLGHDDLWLPHHLSTLVDAIRIEASTVVVHARSAFVVPGEAIRAEPPDGHVFRPGDWIAPTVTMHRRRPITAIGGWRRPEECGTMDPESDLWARAVEAYGPARQLDRLTAVKLPASRRRNVYRDRPSDEQHRWLDRFAQSTDAEGLLRRLIADGSLTEGAPATSLPAILTDPSADAAERHRVRREWKGLQARP